jgi:hypothetical protein
LNTNSFAPPEATNVFGQVNISSNMTSQSYTLNPYIPSDVIPRDFINLLRNGLVGNDVIDHDIFVSVGMPELILMKNTPSPGQLHQEAHLINLFR